MRKGSAAITGGGEGLGAGKMQRGVRSARGGAAEKQGSIGSVSRWTMTGVLQRKPEGEGDPGKIACKAWASCCIHGRV